MAADFGARAHGTCITCTLGGFSGCPLAQAVGGSSTISGPRPVSTHVRMMVGRESEGGPLRRPGRVHSQTSTGVGPGLGASGGRGGPATPRPTALKPTASGPCNGPPAGPLLSRTVRTAGKTSPTLIRTIGRPIGYLRAAEQGWAGRCRNGA